MKNPIGFAWEIGQYENPNIVVPASPASGPAPAPVQLSCPGRTVVYAGDVTKVANCQGFVGFGGGNPWTNPSVMAALARAGAYAPKVTCTNPCRRVASIIWIGWDCGGQPPYAMGGVEIAVDCVLPDPTAITAFKDACRGLDELPAPIFLGHGWSPPRRSKVPKRKRRRNT